MKKNKVLFILHIPPPIHGASLVGQYIKESEKINDVFNAHYIDLTVSNNFEETSRFKIWKILRLIKLNIKVLWVILCNNYDLCYMTMSAKGPGFYKDSIIVFILKLFRKKIIFHFHNKGISNQEENKVNNFLYKTILKNTQTILLSKNLYFDIKKYVKAEDVYYCANGIPITESLIIQNKAPNDHTKPVKILFLSNMMIEKGFFELLTACKILQDKGLDFECHFVGDWTEITEESFSKAVSNYNLSKIVFAHGKKYDGEKSVFFKNSDIFVLPTFYHNECYPLVILEAMQYSLPVISTFEGAIPEMVVNNETGFVGAQRDILYLVDKLEYLIANPEVRLKMGEAGKKRFNNFYTISVFEKRMIEIISKSIQRN